jgi:hypothetical protein
MTTVEAKCVGCSHRWWVKSGDVNSGDMPTCPKCWNIGVATGRAMKIIDTSVTKQDALNRIEGK